MRISLLLLLMGFMFSLQTTKAQEDTLTNSSVQDTLNPADLQEDSFQDYIDNLLEENPGMDLTGWDNTWINNHRSDPSKMTDTVKIPLYDSLKNMTFVNPFKTYITSPFGPRHRIFHYGVDLKLQIGDTVRAAFDGLVRVTKFDPRGFGNVVVIRHFNGLETIYGHLSLILVSTNERVKAGQVIGLGGNSGHSTGSHLHFEMRYQGMPFNPLSFYDFENSVAKCDTLVLSKKSFEYLIELRKAKYCKIRRGDNLGKIARRYHTTVTKLCKLNRISRRTLLRPGRTIRYQ